MHRHRFPAHSLLVVFLFSWTCGFSLHAFTATLELTPVLEAEASTHPIIAVYTSAAPMSTLDGNDVVVGQGTLFKPEIVAVEGSCSISISDAGRRWETGAGHL